VNPALLLAAALSTGATAPFPAVDASLARGAGAVDTRCASCHTTADWREVTFAHDRTGFPLTGRHREIACGACHPDSGFGQPLPTACAPCHRDVHLGRMGTGCGRCHDTSSWRPEEATLPEAHRQTAFPLLGRHAVLPCEECHGDRRDRAFDRPSPRCIGCHEADFGLRAAAAGVDHALAGFSQDCRRCHGPWRFSPAAWPEHDACFQISRGPHAGIACRDCHDAGLPPFTPGALSCASDSADCLRCHSMPGIQSDHSGVAGFQPANRRCYECHRFAG
jgi:hypothetical protein